MFKAYGEASEYLNNLGFGKWVKPSNDIFELAETVRRATNDRIAASNAWDMVWNYVKEDKLFKEMEKKLIEDGCYSSSVMIVEYIEKLKSRADL